MPDLPIPLSFFYRLFIFAKQNPCTIEVLTDENNKQSIRIRNDSSTPIQLFDVDFYWKTKGSKKFNNFDSPMVWCLSPHTQSSLNPSHSFEHPIDVHEKGEPIAECEVRVIHNRSKYPSKKRFKVKN